ncbi:MAG: hypothetical protein R2757_08445 [Draconibacterium sp.]
MLVASVIPAEPSPCANNIVTQNEKNRVNMDFNELIFAIMIYCLCFPDGRIRKAVLLIFIGISLGNVVKPQE